MEPLDQGYRTHLQKGKGVKKFNLVQSKSQSLLFTEKNVIIQNTFLN